MNTFPFVSSSSESLRDEVISTGLAGVDEMLGVGGLPRGRIVELFGPAGCGKTTIALNWMAAAQSQGATVLYMDVERAFDAAWAAKCGLNLKDLVMVTPESGTHACSIVDSLLRTFTLDLVVIDSAAAMVPETELETPLDEMDNGLHEEFLISALRKLSALAQRARASLLFLNQVRYRGLPGSMEVSAGGRGLPIYSAIRVQVMAAAPVGEARQIRLTTVKNKLAEPYLEAGVELSGATLRDWERKPAGRAVSMGKAVSSGG